MVLAVALVAIKPLLQHLIATPMMHKKGKKFNFMQEEIK